MITRRDVGDEGRVDQRRLDELFVDLDELLGGVSARDAWNATPFDVDRQLRSLELVDAVSRSRRQPVAASADRSDAPRSRTVLQSVA